MPRFSDSPLDSQPKIWLHRGMMKEAHLHGLCKDSRIFIVMFDNGAADHLITDQLIYANNININILQI